MNKIRKKRLHGSYCVDFIDMYLIEMGIQREKILTWFVSDWIQSNKANKKCWITHAVPYRIFTANNEPCYYMYSFSANETNGNDIKNELTNCMLWQNVWNMKLYAGTFCLKLLHVLLSTLKIIWLCTMLVKSLAALY